MRIKVKAQRLNDVIMELELCAGCKVTRTPEGRFVFERRLLNPARGTILETRSGEYKKQIQAVKAAIRVFGREMVQVKRLAEKVEARDCSLSVTQRYFEVLLDGVKIDVLSNDASSHGGTLNWSRANPWQRYDMEQARLVGARFILTQRRSYLPETVQWIDAVVETLAAIRGEGRNAQG